MLLRSNLYFVKTVNYFLILLCSFVRMFINVVNLANDCSNFILYLAALGHLLGFESYEIVAAL